MVKKGPTMFDLIDSIYEKPKKKKSRTHKKKRGKKSKSDKKKLKSKSKKSLRGGYMPARYSYYM